MKVIKLFIFLPLNFIFFNLFAQTPKTIEADLLKSFKKIEYWNGQRSVDTSAAWSDSVERANDVFAGKLKYYGTKFPFTIGMQFYSFIDETLRITDSGDGMFRIYSWNTLMGGTERYFRNVIQYKTEKNTNAVLTVDSTVLENDDNYIPDYSRIHILKAGNKTYYLGIYFGIYDSHSLSQGMHVFSIENGALNQNPRIIKTKTGLHSKIEYFYDLFLARDKHELHYNQQTKTLYIPVALDNGEVTMRYIAYKFNGQYFERIKK